MKLLRPVVPLIAGPLQLQKIELCFLTVGCVRITYRRERRASENESIPRLAEANKQQLRPNDCLWKPSTRRGRCYRRTLQAIRGGQGREGKGASFIPTAQIQMLPDLFRGLKGLKGTEGDWRGAERPRGRNDREGGWLRAAPVAWRVLISYIRLCVRGRGGLSIGSVVGVCVWCAVGV